MENNRKDDLSAENTALKNRLALLETERSTNASSVSNGYTATRYPENYNYKQQEAKTVIVPVPMGNFNATPTSQLTDTMAKDSVYLAKSSSAIDSIQQKLSTMQAQLNKLILQAQIAKENTKLNNQESATQMLSQQQYLQKQIEQLQQKNKLLSDSLSKQTTNVAKKDQQRLAIYFKINDTNIDHQAAQQLKNYATIIKGQQPKWILLEGFTDKSGNPDYNLKLSQQRVASVKAFLTKLGVASSQLLEKNFGSKFATEKQSDSERKVTLSLWYE
ncbi:OmpA family protein [Pedobacter sp. SL55]|uniref:OmpA family protein n=1 Tax=Pedobacter sp. SL55 TaxID=2995161 RepID=UPI0022704457|nr:OmpA family protein [Pedobacter sp. SL55]WAC39301.1 OmpA family protein [Pedobacter sp. SL55]